MPSSLKALILYAASIGAPALAQADPHAAQHPAPVATAPAHTDAPAAPAQSDGPAAPGNCPMMSGQGMSGGAMPMPAQGSSMMKGGTMMGSMDPNGMMANAQAMHGDIQALRQEIAALRSELRRDRIR